MYKVSSFLFLLSFSLSVWAQNSETDSLIRLLNKSAEDTNKVHLYWNTGASIIYQDAKAAIPYFKKGAVLATKLDFISGMERCHNATSLAFSFNSQYDSALVYINYAIPYAIKAGNIKRLALAYLNRADVYRNLQNFSAALKDCNTAIDYAEEINNKDYLGRIYSNISDIHGSLKQYPQAIASLNKSDQFFQQVNNRQMIAMNYSYRAELFIYLNEPDKAIPYYKKAIHLADSLQDIENLSAYHGSLSNAFAQVKNYSAAEATAKLGLQYAMQTGDKKQEAVIYDNLGNQALLQNNFIKATEYCLQAYTIFKAQNDLLRAQAIAATLADAFYKSGNALDAYTYLKISSELSDSLVKQHFSDETAKLQTTFEVREKDKEIILLGKNQELKTLALSRQKVLIISITTALILVLIIGFLVVNRYRLKNRANRLIEMERMRNTIARDLHDDIGSTLSSINIMSQIALQQNGNARQHHLQNIANHSARMMENMSDIVWSINPTNDSLEQLVTKMKEFASEILEPKEIDYKFYIDSTLLNSKLDVEKRKNIFLIFKESVNNTAKYSEGNQVTISLFQSTGNLHLTVGDNGKGFDAAIAKKGNGLRNMQDRANAIQGELKRTSKPGEGTQIDLEVPLT